MRVVLPIQIKKSANKATDIDDDLVTVNGFLFRRLSEIDIRRYSDDVGFCLQITQLALLTMLQIN